MAHPKHPVMVLYRMHQCHMNRHTCRQRIDHQRHHCEPQHHDICFTKHTNTPRFASRQSYASGVAPAPPVGPSQHASALYISPYAEASHRSSSPFRSPYPSTSFRSTPYGSTPYASAPYESAPYYTPYYRSAPSGPSTLAPPATPAASPSASVSVPPGPTAAVISPDLSTIQEETPSVTGTRVLSPAHQRDEPHESPTQVQGSTRGWENYNEPSSSFGVADLPPGFVPISPGIGGVRNAGRDVDHSDTEAGYPTSGQVKEPLVDSNTTTHDKDGSIRPTSVVAADNSNMGGIGGGGAQASTSTVVPASSNPGTLSAFVEMSQLPRQHSFIPSFTTTTTQGQQASPLRPHCPLFFSAETQSLANRDVRDHGYGPYPQGDPPDREDWFDGGV